MKYFNHKLTFNIEPQLWSIALSPNGKLIVTGGLDENTIHVWDTQTGQLLNSWIATSSPPNYNIKYPLHSLVISHDGSTLITGGLSLKKWNLETGKRICILKGGIGHIANIVISSDDTILFSQINGKMVAWNLIKNEKISSGVLDYCSISPDCKKFIGIEGDEKSLEVLDLATGKLINVLKSKSGIRVQNLTFSQNGKFLAGGGYEGITIWNFETGECVQVIDKFKNIRFHEHLDQILSIVFNSDDNNLWTTGRDGTIQFWDMTTGKNIGTIQSENPISKIYMSNDCQTLIGVSGRQKIEVWRTM
jgi:WD40 repeat protein